MSKINSRIVFLKNEADYIDHKTSELDCKFMNAGEYRATADIISQCAECPLLQECRPWLYLRDYSRDDFESAGNNEQVLKELGALT